MSSEAREFKEWEMEGMARGWIGAAVCITHDGYPTTLAEDEETEEGGDPCIHMHRLYESREVGVEVEKNHSPSVWRRSF